MKQATRQGSETTSMNPVLLVGLIAVTVLIAGFDYMEIIPAFSQVTASPPFQVLHAFHDVVAVALAVFVAYRFSPRLGAWLIVLFVVSHGPYYYLSTDMDFPELAHMLIVVAIGLPSTAIIANQQQAYRLFQHMGTASPIGIYVVQDGKFRYTNPQFQKIVGYTKDELLHGSPPKLVHTEDAERVRETAVEMLKDKATQPYEFRAITKGEGTKWILETVASIRYHGKRATLGNFVDITERKRLEEKNAYLASFPEENPSPVLELDNEGNLKYMNPSAIRSLSDIAKFGVNHPFLTDWAQVVKELRDSNRSKPIIREVEANGSFYEQVISASTENQIRVYSIDITHRKQAEAALKTSERRFKDLAELLPQAVLENSAQGVITFMNRIAREQYGYSDEDLAREISVVQLVAPEERARVQEILRAYLKGAPSGKHEFRAVAKDGRTFPVAVYVSPILQDNQVVGCRAVTIDLTEQKRAEADKQRLQEKAEVSSRLAAVGEMAAGIAHEINNPLTGVIGFSELLMTRDLPADVKEELKIINDGSQRVQQIVKRMLTFARQVKPMKTSVNVNELIDATLDLRSYVLKTANIHVAKHLDPSLPCVMADPGQMQQVFLNLIVNAEYAMKKAHGKGILTITTERKDDHIRISVHDDGTGMSPETKAKVFQPFFTTKQVGEGTGLGLGLSRSIILEHAGTIEVESVPGQDTTFIITLPVTPLTEEAIAEAPVITAAPTEKVRAARILVVDDEDAIRNLVKVILEECGHTVDETGNPLDVLQKLDTTSYDVILLDMRMPGLGGRELHATIMEKHPELAQKVIVVTGDGLGPDIKEYFEKNNVTHIAKPFNRETLLRKVNGLL